MFDYKRALIARSKERIPGVSYNNFLRAHLEKEEARRPLIYEITVKENEPWEQFRDRTFPSFARYLKSKKLDPEYPKDVIIAAFIGDYCYLIEGQEFIELFKEIEGLNSAAFHFRVLQWLT